MSFEIANKVALVTGGAGGLGFGFAEELLRNGVRGLTIADVDSVAGHKAVEKLNKTFGEGKSIFVKTDVTKKSEFEEAFKSTVEKFKNVDILVNNAGITDDTLWEKVIAVNVNGVIHGANLAMEKYLKHFRTTDEAVMVNISSILGLLKGVAYKPVYSATKSAIITLSQCWGAHTNYEKTGVRTVALCPGPTRYFGIEAREELPDSKVFTIRNLDPRIKLQSSDTLATELVRIIKYAKSGTVWVVENDEPAYEFVEPERDTFKENILTETQLTTLT